MGFFVGGDTQDEWGQILGNMVSGWSRQGMSPEGELSIAGEAPAAEVPVAPESKFSLAKMDEYARNPGLMSALARIGAGFSGKNTPMGNAGTVVADVGKGLQMNEAMKKLLGPYMKQAGAGGGAGPAGVGTGTESKKSDLGFPQDSQTGLSSLGAVGLDATELQNMYGKAADTEGATQTRGIQGMTALAHLLTAKAALEAMPTDVSLKKAHAAYYTQSANKLAQDASRAAVDDASWDTFRKDPLTTATLQAMGLNQAAVASIINADRKTGMGELAKYGIEQYKEEVKTNVVPEGSILTKGGKAVFTNPKSPTEADKGWVNTDAGNLAFGDIRKDVEADYIASLGKGKEKEGRQKLGQLFLDLQDPTKSAAASSALYGAMSPATKEKYLKLKDAYSASKTKTGSWQRYKDYISNPNPAVKGALGASPDTVPGNTVFDKANAESQARWLESKRPQIEASLMGKPPGNYTIPRKTGAPLKVYWDGKTVSFKISVPGGK